jgi:chemotaxis protein methyltransferase CheR/type IV pilus assembly protein PilK
MLVSEVTSQETLLQMSEAEFLLWQKLIETKTGLWLTLTRKTFLLTQLSSRLRAKGFSDYSEYYQWLTNNVMEKDEWANLVDLLTVHETRFFRDNKALELVELFSQKMLSRQDDQRAQLRSEAVKKILEKSRPRIASIMQIWSVGCSTGEEVYSLAMVLENLAQQQNKNTPLYFGVTGTDISFPSLATARDAKYQPSRIRNIPQEYQQQFTRSNENGFEITEALKDKVCFMQGNLGELNETPVQFFDIIYCQNVLIYFKSKRKEIILDQLVDRLTEGGMLILAPGEATNWKHDEMERQSFSGCLAYTKKITTNKNAGRANGKK